MVIKTEKGMYQVQMNHRDAFDKTAFCDKYIEECMDKYEYIVGDISSGVLRLKGFDTNPKSKSYYGFIEDYLEVSCAFGCAYYVLKRIKTEEEFERLKDDNTVYEFNQISITPIQKENFDKESLNLNSSEKGKPRIIIDMNKINSMPKGELSADLVELVKQDKNNNNSNNSSKSMKAVKEENTQTYVSASPDFDPSKSNSSKFNRNNQNKNNNNNNNKNNHNNHKNHNKNKNKNNGNKK